MRKRLHRAWGPQQIEQVDVRVDDIVDREVRRGDLGHAANLTGILVPCPKLPLSPTRIGRERLR